MQIQDFINLRLHFIDLINSKCLLILSNQYKYRINYYTLNKIIIIVIIHFKGLWLD